MNYSSNNQKEPVGKLHCEPDGQWTHLRQKTDLWLQFTTGVNPDDLSEWYWILEIKAGFEDLLKHADFSEMVSFKNPLKCI